MFALSSLSILNRTEPYTYLHKIITFRILEKIKVIKFSLCSSRWLDPAMLHRERDKFLMFLNIIISTYKMGILTLKYSSMGKHPESN